MTTLTEAVRWYNLDGEREPTNEYPPAGGTRAFIDVWRTPVGLVAGKRIDGDSDPCHYILDDEYVHTGACLDEFLRDQWRAMGVVGKPSERDLAELWTVYLVQEGCWTPFSKADVEANGGDPNNLFCKVCNQAIWLPN